jgi:hypothetical protein
LNSLFIISYKFLNEEQAVVPGCDNPLLDTYGEMNE